MKKESVIKLLKNRQVSYKELANITGYHEKSLIRLNKEIKNNTISVIHGNKGKKPHNYIDNETKEKLIDNYKKNNYKSIKSYYNKLKGKYSYSFLCKLLPKSNNEKTFLLKRKAIKHNMIQFNNVRYKILNANIKRLNIVYLEPNLEYIIYNNERYNIKPIKKLKSKKGLSKYN